jgi:hypothetical protein
MNTEQIIKRAYKFNTFKNANSFRLGSIQPGKWSIILGDNNLYFVVTNREASVLINSGYELFY